MIHRSAETELRTLATQFKAVAVTGPRQSGKTTLVRSVFTDKPYVNLENPDIRRYATEDPRGFLSNYQNGAIFDEIQRTPDLFSYLQQILDENSGNGLFILTGSNNFRLQESISQSLAGRIGYLYLLPLSLQELNTIENNANELLLKGGYPALYNDKPDPGRWFANYISTYIERDVRLLKNITDLSAFERFLRLCASRTGQLLNMSSLSIEVGKDVKTISSWISVLETSFVVFRLHPYFENFNKRVVKMPKLYFFDTGLAAYLMQIENTSRLLLHPFRGNLFENMIVTELIKKRFNAGLSNNLYFWRDNTGHEIDVLMVNGSKKIPIEIKSGQTITADYLKGIQFWHKLTHSEGGFVIYGGNTVQQRSMGINILPFSQLHNHLFD